VNKPSIRLLITDLDNTLYDWVSYFANSFTALVNKAAEILSVPHEQLLDEFKEVHLRYHNSEHPFALLEIASVVSKYGHLSRRECKDLLDPAFHAFNKARKVSLVAYPGVLETLVALRDAGTNIIGHTEATVPNALFRLNALGLLPFLTRLYAVEHTGLPHPISERENADKSMADLITIVSASQRKPNPELLLRICNEMGVPPQETVYVGDSITRDVSMAKIAGVWAAWAEYGTEFQKDYWTTLVRVTHWTPEDVQREELLREQFGRLEPDVTLKQFADLKHMFSFKHSPAVSTASV
jgi:phosphoglycolate phosphatase